MKFDAESVMIPYHLYDNEDKDLIKSAMIEFARIHVERAIKEILEHTRPLLLTNKHGSSTTGKYAGLTNTITLNKEQLKNAYPLTNIK